MSLLLVEVAQIFQWVLLGILLILIVAAPFYFRFMNKKETDKQSKLIDTLEKGDRVLTAAGIVGKVVAFEDKDGFNLVTIETGTAKNKGYLTLDVYAIAENLSKPMQLQNEPKEEQPKEEVVEVPEAPAEEVAPAKEIKAEAPAEEPAQEKPKKTRKSKK